MRAVVLAGLLVPASARGDHHPETVPDGVSSFDASVSILAATFSTMFSGGDYEGVVPAVGWANKRVGVGASWAYYRLLENGYARFGDGDLGFHARATALGEHDLQVGPQLAVSIP